VDLLPRRSLDVVLALLATSRPVGRITDALDHLRRPTVVSAAYYAQKNKNKKTKKETKKGRMKKDKYERFKVGQSNEFGDNRRTRSKFDD
jgi:hypothetical protein